MRAPLRDLRALTLFRSPRPACPLLASSGALSPGAARCDLTLRSNGRIHPAKCLQVRLDTHAAQSPRADWTMGFGCGGCVPLEQSPQPSSPSAGFKWPRWADGCAFVGFVSNRPTPEALSDRFRDRCHRSLPADLLRTPCFPPPLPPAASRSSEWALSQRPRRRPTRRQAASHQLHATLRHLCCYGWGFRCTSAGCV